MKTSEWSRSDTLALAVSACRVCHGLGLRSGRRGVSSPCNCALRSIFRICFKRWRALVLREKYLSKCNFVRVAGPQGRGGWGRVDEEYIADFEIIARRTLEPELHKIFRLHFVLGADWRLCSGRLGMDKGLFFHAVYRIEQQLGRAFRDTEPYGLFPLDEYFGGTACTAKVVVMAPREQLPALRPPLRKVA